MNRKFQVGDKVSFLNEVGGGVVARIVDENTVEVTTDDGFDMPYEVHELIPATTNADYDVSRIESKEPVRFKGKEWVKNPKPDFLEFDLHLHVLVENRRDLTNYEMLQIQLTHFRKGMDKARDKKMRKAVFIHGVGEGILRSEIRRILSEEYTNIEYQDAAFKTYGFGATEVIFFY